MFGYNVLGFGAGGGVGPYNIDFLVVGAGGGGGSTRNTGNNFGLQAVACADNDTIDVAYGTAVNVTDAGIGTVEDQQITAESGAVTVAGSPAAGELTYFQLFRDANAGGDTFSADARVLGVKIFFTTDAANDA